MTAPQPFAYYDDTRYAAQPAYPAAYAPRSATVAPGHQSDLRKLPPLSTTPAPGRDERWASSYQTPAFNGAGNNHIRSPTASYPASYTTYPAGNAYGYHVNDPRCVSALSPQMMANDPRAVSPYGRSSAHASPPTPPPVSPISSDEPAVKKKRKRADAAQLRVLNETYARTAFPSTEERLALAKALDMSPRSVQIWFQNKRQSMRQTNRQSSTAHQSFSLSPDEHILDDLDYESSMAAAGTSRPSTSQMPSSSHRRARSQEDVIDPRKWPRGY
ncbi:Homeodomain-like protein [Mycena crocata]|nr:Homeodomain-like protein [Mycena crocata]